MVCKEEGGTGVACDGGERRMGAVTPGEALGTLYRDMPNPGLEPLFWFLALGGGWPLFKNGALV